MTINLRTDSNGNDFQVWSQQQAMSCGVASLWMAECLARQASIAEGEWALAWQAYQTAILGVTDTTPAPPPMTSSPTVPGPGMGAVFEIAGLDTTQLVTVIRSRGLKASRVTTTGNPLTIDTAKIGDGKPAICLVGWYTFTPTGIARDAAGNPIRSGGHFIVAARRATSGRIVILDPMGGQLREVANTGVYQGNGLIENIVYVSL